MAVLAAAAAAAAAAPAPVPAATHSHQKRPSARRGATIVDPTSAAALAESIAQRKAAARASLAPDVLAALDALDGSALPGTPGGITTSGAGTGAEAGAGVRPKLVLVDDDASDDSSSEESNNESGDGGGVGGTEAEPVGVAGNAGTTSSGSTGEATAPMDTEVAPMTERNTEPPTQEAAAAAAPQAEAITAPLGESASSAAAARSTTPPLAPTGTPVAATTPGEKSPAAGEGAAPMVVEHPGVPASAPASALPYQDGTSVPEPPEPQRSGTGLTDVQPPPPQPSHPSSPPPPPLQLPTTMPPPSIMEVAACAAAVPTTGPPEVLTDVAAKSSIAANAAKRVRVDVDEGVSGGAATFGGLAGAGAAGEAAAAAAPAAATALTASTASPGPPPASSGRLVLLDDDSDWDAASSCPCLPTPADAPAAPAVPPPVRATGRKHARSALAVVPPPFIEVIPIGGDGAGGTGSGPGSHRPHASLLAGSDGGRWTKRRTPLGSPGAAGAMAASGRALTGSPAPVTTSPVGATAAASARGGSPASSPSPAASPASPDTVSPSASPPYAPIIVAECVAPATPPRAPVVPAVVLAVPPDATALPGGGSGAPSALFPGIPAPNANPAAAVVTAATDALPTAPPQLPPPVDYSTGGGGGPYAPGAPDGPASAVPQQAEAALPTWRPTWRTWEARMAKRERLRGNKALLGLRGRG